MARRIVSIVDRARDEQEITNYVLYNTLGHTAEQNTGRYGILVLTAFKTHYNHFGVTIEGVCKNPCKLRSGYLFPPFLPTTCRNLSAGLARAKGQRWVSTCQLVT